MEKTRKELINSTVEKIVTNELRSYLGTNGSATVKAIDEEIKYMMSTDNRIIDVTGVGIKNTITNGIIDFHINYVYETQATKEELLNKQIDEIKNYIMLNVENNNEFLEYSINVALNGQVIVTHVPSNKCTVLILNEDSVNTIHANINNLITWARA